MVLVQQIVKSSFYRSNYMREITRLVTVRPQGELLHRYPRKVPVLIYGSTLSKMLNRSTHYAQ